MTQYPAYNAIALPRYPFDQIHAVAVQADNDGDVVQLASGLFGVVQGVGGGNDAVAVGDPVCFRIAGVYDVLANTADIYADGAPVFFDTVNLIAVTTASGTCFYLGSAVGAKLSGSNRVRVLLNGNIAPNLGSAASVTTLTVSSTASLEGNTTVSGTLGVTGAATLSSTIAVTGAGTFSSTASFAGLVTASVGITIPGAHALTFTGTTGQATIVAPSNEAAGLTLKDAAANSYLIVVTTTATPGLTLSQNTSMASGKTLALYGHTLAAAVTATPAQILYQVTLVTTASALAAFVNLPNPATWGVGVPCVVVNTGGASAQTVTVGPYASETVQGTTSATIAAGKQATFYTDGTNWFGS